MARPTLRKPSHGIEGIANRLADEAAVIAQLETALRGHKRRRNLLIAKLIRAGISTREIGAVAGISSPAVVYANRNALAGLDAGRGDGA